MPRPRRGAERPFGWGWLPLAEQLEACAGDGIDCSKCMAATRCLAYWDIVVDAHHSDSYDVSVAKLHGLRRLKWALAGVEIED